MMHAAPWVIHGEETLEKERLHYSKARVGISLFRNGALLKKRKEEKKRSGCADSSAVPVPATVVTTSLVSDKGHKR